MFEVRIDSIECACLTWRFQTSTKHLDFWLICWFLEGLVVMGCWSYQGSCQDSYAVPTRISFDVQGLGRLLEKKPFSSLSRGGFACIPCSFLLVMPGNDNIQWLFTPTWWRFYDLGSISGYLLHNNSFGAALSISVVWSLFDWRWLPASGCCCFVCCSLRCIVELGIRPRASHEGNLFLLILTWAIWALRYWLDFCSLFWFNIPIQEYRRMKHHNMLSAAYTIWKL